MGRLSIVYVKNQLLFELLIQISTYANDVPLWFYYGSIALFKRYKIIPKYRKKNTGSQTFLDQHQPKYMF